MNQGKIKLAIILLSAIIFTVIALFFIDSKYKVVVVKAPKITHVPAPVAENKGATSTTDANNSTSSILNLKSLNLKVPFTPQAPTANWDQIHNEDFLFGSSSGDYNSWFIKGHNRSIKLNLKLNSANYYNMQFLGWTE